MARYFRRKKFCRFTAEKATEIDYKDLATLKNYVSETGKITRTVPLQGTREPVGFGRVGEELWVCDCGFGWVRRVDVDRPEQAPHHILPGPMPMSLTQAGDAVWHSD